MSASGAVRNTRVPKHKQPAKPGAPRHRRSPAPRESAGALARAGTLGASARASAHTSPRACRPLWGLSTAQNPCACLQNVALAMGLGQNECLHRSMFSEFRVLVMFNHVQHGGGVGVGGGGKLSGYAAPALPPCQPKVVSAATFLEAHTFAWASRGRGRWVGRGGARWGGGRAFQREGGRALPLGCA